MKGVTFTLKLAAIFISLPFFANASEAKKDDFKMDAAFALICPANVTISCDDDTYNLDQYGIAYVHGYGNPEPAPPPTVTYNLNSCGVGHILRVWTVYDYGGTAHSCSQVINVTGGGFGLGNIDWPLDFTTTECWFSLHPSNLPEEYKEPKVDAVECGSPAIGYSDWVFDFNDSGCKKILREWTVIDWCVYNPNAYYPQGIWTHTQVLMVKIMEKPEIECPQDITVSTENMACDGADVNLPSVTATGFCGNPADVSNDSPHAIYSGKNASGFYPLGTTVVKFTADDGCKNKSSCMTKVTVKDLKQPTPVCLHGLASTLSHHPDGYYLDLEAKWFNRNSFDNCTPKNKLKFEVEPKRLTCDDIGEVEVKLYVTDEAGNTDFCVTYIIVKDNFEICPPDTSTLTISGNFYTLTDEVVDEFNIYLLDEENEIISTSNLVDGSYQFSNFPNGEFFTVAPVSIDHPLNGVSTMDLLFITKFISGLWEPEDPIDLLSADVNFSGGIDVVDIAYLRDLILGRKDQFPGNKSWRFIDMDYEFRNSFDAVLDPVPESIELILGDEDISGVDFLALKMGDINRSFSSSSSNQESSERHADQLLQVHQNLNDDFYSYSVQALDGKMTYGAQFAWNVGVNNEVLMVESDVFDGENIHYHIDDLGILRVSVVQMNGVYQTGENLVTITLVEKVKTLSQYIFENEIYLNANSASSIDFELIGPSIVDDMVKVYPNPFNSDISIFMGGNPEPGELVAISVADVTGRIVWNRTYPAENIINGIRISFEDLGPGMYFLYHETDSQQGMVKLVKN